MTRAESLIAELSARHDNRDPAFLAAVRPMVEQILDGAMAADARIHLLEMLAETFERDSGIRRDMAMARRGWAQWLQRLRQQFGP